MKIIVGLGNHGQKFKGTRHNIGFEILDKIQKENNFPEFSLKKKLKSEISEGVLNGEKIILTKPQTFMNLSGEAVKTLMKYYKVKPGNLTVIHDDIDISLGKIKESNNSGSAGHKGVQSIIDNLKTKEFKRIRMGTLPKKGKPKDIDKFVLKKFSKTEEKIIEETIKNISYS